MGFWIGLAVGLVVGAIAGALQVSFVAIARRVEWLEMVDHFAGLVGQIEEPTEEPRRRGTL